MKRLTALGLCIGLALAVLPLLMRAYSGAQQWELQKQWNAARQAALKQNPAASGEAAAGATDKSIEDSEVDSDGDSDLNAPPASADDNRPAPAIRSAGNQRPPARNQSAGNQGATVSQRTPGSQRTLGSQRTPGGQRTPGSRGTTPGHAAQRNTTPTPPMILAKASTDHAKHAPDGVSSSPQSTLKKTQEHSPDRLSLQPAFGAGADHAADGFALGPSLDLNPGAVAAKAPLPRARPRPQPRPFTDRWPLRLQIPRLRLDVFVVKNVTNSALADGPGHFPETALPWQLGNCVIAGHRNIWGSWFDHLSHLRPGDKVILETVRHRYVYRITGRDVVSPGDTSVLKDHGTRRELTLVTCTPGATHRLVAHALYQWTAPS